MKRIPIIFSEQKVILAFYLGVSMLAGFWQYAYGPVTYDHFLILRAGFEHLAEQQNLYLHYPGQYAGTYGYHPIVSILFAPFSFLSIATGMTLWLSIVSCILFYSIKYLPISPADKVWFWWLILAELVLSFNFQLHDPLLGALGLLTLASFQRGRSRSAAMYPVIAACLHPFGILFAALFVFYPNRRKYLLHLVICALIICIIPLYFTGIDYFIRVYSDWAISLLATLGPVADAATRVRQSWVSSVNLWNLYAVAAFFFGLIWVTNLVRIALIDRKRMLLLLAYCCIWISILQNGPWTASNFLTSLALILFFLANKERPQPYLTVFSVTLLLVIFSTSLDMYVTDWLTDSERLQLWPGIMVLLTLQFLLLSPKSENRFAIK
ncbi:hypothetical protein [Dyadobacter sp. CY323]|uniref:hypothetical protein n=1 Tax=Dyadobacter sp. CY323 TaxID=2907302 RepID=UPI001F19E1B2|nr:hypothetical protein [Dyadobacter sp. CY323]MCE6989818.1 hypothetical protein [Dyadobacter sp. CY323]